MAYIIKRNPIKYLDGKFAPDSYYKGNLLGFIELTTNTKNAAKYSRKADAIKVLKVLSGRFHIVKEENEVKA